MPESIKKDQKKNKINEESTFTVPYALEEIQENIIITTHKSSKEEILKLAIKFHSKGKVLEASKYYQYLINQGSNDHRVFANYGIILKDNGKLKEAEECYRKAIEINPDFENAHLNLGNILKDLGNLKDAEKYYRKAIEINPDFENAHLNLGNILKDLGNLKDAEKCYRKAIEINPDFENAHLNLGGILKDLGNLKDAEACYRKAIEINPGFENAHSNLGSILINMGKSKDAEKSYRKAIEINPDCAEAHFNLGSLLIDMGKLKELILLSKSTLQSRSINSGDKLCALLRITIANLVQNNFSETLMHINQLNKLISQGVINTIEDLNNRRYTSNFSRFITLLYPLLEKENNNPDREKIPHIGESHCLSFAHQKISISSLLKQIQPVLITGGKAWHFANNENNRWKASLNQQIKQHNYSDKVFISFGEIDCRKDEGILSYSIKKNKDISKVCEKTINGYLDYMENTLSPYYSKRYYFGVAAPTKEKQLLDELDIRRIKIIKIYNSILRKNVLLRGSYYLDIYELTSTKNGINNNIYMCDQTHMSPKCLSILFDHHLYEPKPLTY